MHRVALFVLALGLMFGMAETSVPASAQIALPTSFTYQGFVANTSGPLNGTANLTFSLWSDPVSVSVANRLGTAQTITGVPISNGRFTVELNASGQFSASAFSGDARWLEVSVNGVTQAPRTKVLGTPYSHRATIANALRLPFAAQSTIASGAMLQILNDSQFGRSAIMGTAGGFTGNSGATFEPCGVRGESAFKAGVLGVSTTSNGYGVVGLNEIGGTGVLGTASGPGGVGVSGEASGTNGVGVFGRAVGGGVAGVRAEATDPGSYALLASHQDKNAVAFLCSGRSVFGIGDVQLGNESGSIGAGTLILRRKNFDTLLLQPSQMTANDFVQITFSDPDSGTPAVGLRYTDAGNPARIDVVGGSLRGVLENISTIRSKKDVTPVGSALNDLLRLRPVEFTWSKEYGGGRDVGLIAEEVAAIFPSVTGSRDGQIDSIRYSGVTALLVRGMQEQQEQLENMRAENAALRERLERLEKKLEMSAR
ncbi:MAG: tail fiber domain-containing protein [Phycisphaeraceae bacterium]|nr:tail fiber domain-containing protein [Phycisphaeraceae bacterium]